jgi:hypothetical protein
VAQRSRTWNLSGDAGPWWQLALFLLLGMAMCTVILFGMFKLQNSGQMIGLAAIILGPPLAFVGYIITRQVASAEWTLVTNLKWWHWLWLVIFASGLVFRQRAATTVYTAPVDTAAVYRIFLVFFCAGWLLLALFTRTVHWVESLFRGMVGCLTIFALYAALTMVWSVYPTWTLYKACEYSVDLAALAAILLFVKSINEFKSLFDWTWTFFGLALISAYVSAIIDPKDALEHGYSLGSLGVRLKGVYPMQGANRIGDLSAIMCVIALVRWLPMEGKCRKNSFYIFLGLFGGVTLILSQTRTAMLGCAVGAFLVLWVGNRINLRSLLTWGAASAVLLTFVLAATPIGDVVMTFLRRGQTDQQISSLSGRLLWWETAYDLYSRTPLGIGMGAFAAEKVPVLNAIGLAGETLHSDYMETLLGMGWYGLTPLILSLAGTWWFLLKNVHHPLRSPMERQVCLEAIGVLGVLSVRTVFMDIMILHPAQHYFVILGLAEWFRRNSVPDVKFQRVPVAAFQPMSYRG